MCLWGVTFISRRGTVVGWLCSVAVLQHGGRMYSLFCFCRWHVRILSVTLGLADGLTGYAGATAMCVGVLQHVGLLNDIVILCFYFTGALCHGVWAACHRRDPVSVCCKFCSCRIVALSLLW